MDEFWDKVIKCEHKNLSPEYFAPIYCSTPYCNGEEYHCLDCGVYISDCLCRCNQGMSGWSHKRWKNYWSKK